MPIILTTAILVIPNYIVNLGIFPWLNFLTSFNLFIDWLLLLILVFSSFLFVNCFKSKIFQINLKKWLWQYQVFDLDYKLLLFKASYKTSNFNWATMLCYYNNSTQFIESTLNITGLMGYTTSLLILAGVVLDLIHEINNIYYSNVYNNMYQ
jgi:hypothetical protein